MQLYFSPNTCSLAAVIVASEAGIDLDLVQVDIMTNPHRLPDGSDFAAVNSKNYVPMLVIDDGEAITEVSVILQYLADHAPDTGLAAPSGTIDRLRQQQSLNVIGTELHKAYSPWLFHPDVGESAQVYARNRIAGRLALLDAQLSEHAYLDGDHMTVADAYFFVMVVWSGFTNVPLGDFANISSWFTRMKARPAVVKALRLHAANTSKAA